MKHNPGSFAYARKRTKDNLLWLLIISVLIALAATSCTTPHSTSNCRLTRGYVGYGNR